MTFKALATPLALFLGMALGTSAFAQTMVGTITVSDEDLPIVQRYCEDLADERADTGTASNGNGGEEEAEVDPLDQVQIPDVDLSSLTLDDCDEAGLLEGYEPKE